MQRRNTIQKDLVLQAVQQLRSHVTADEVYEHVKSLYPNIGKGTVYRNLSILSEEGSIRKVEMANGPDRYDFTLQDHYHVRCLKCNRVFDVDMETVPDLMNRITDSHGMLFLGCDISFKGICEECREKMKKGEIANG